MKLTFFQVASVTLTLEAAIFLAKSGLALSPRAIAGLAWTNVTYNPDLVDSFSAQQADTVAGVALLLLGFVLQLVVLFWPLTIDDIGPPHRKAALWAIVLALVVGGGAYVFVGGWAASTAADAKQIIKAAQEGSANKASKVSTTQRP